MTANKKKKTQVKPSVLRIDAKRTHTKCKFELREAKLRTVRPTYIVLQYKHIKNRTNSLKKIPQKKKEPCKKYEIFLFHGCHTKKLQSTFIKAVRTF